MATAFDDVLEKYGRVSEHLPRGRAKWVQFAVGFKQEVVVIRGATVQFLSSIGTLWRLFEQFKEQFKQRAVHSSCAVIKAETGTFEEVVREALVRQDTHLRNFQQLINEDEDFSSSEELTATLEISLLAMTAETELFGCVRSAVDLFLSETTNGDCEQAIKRFLDDVKTYSEKIEQASQVALRQSPRAHVTAQVLENLPPEKILKQLLDSIRDLIDCLANVHSSLAQLQTY